MKLKSLFTTPSNIKTNPILEAISPSLDPQDIVDQINQFNGAGSASLNKNDPDLIDINKNGLIIHKSWVKNGKLAVRFGKLKGHFFAAGCGLTTLEDFPRKIDGAFIVRDNPELTSLIGGPSIVQGDYKVNNNGLTSLEGIARTVGSLARTTALVDVSGNNIKSLHDIGRQIKHLPGVISLDFDNIEDSILGLMLIEGLKGFYTYRKAGVITFVKSEQDLIDGSFPKNAKAFAIIQDHLGKHTTDLTDIQDDFIDANLNKFAHL